MRIETLAVHAGYTPAPTTRPRTTAAPSSQRVSRSSATTPSTVPICLI